MKTFFDAPHLNDFIDPVRLSVDPVRKFPIRQDLTAIEYSIRFVQRSEYFRPAPLGIICPDDPKALLFDESDPVANEHGLVEFTRHFATIPANREEFETGSFNFPGFKNSSDEILRENFSQIVVFKTVYTYQYATNPDNEISLDSRFNVIDQNGSRSDYVSPSTIPSLANYITEKDAGNYLQSEDTEVERWRGNIWEIRNKFVRAK